jgi:polyphenol oxidase
LAGREAGNAETSVEQDNAGPPNDGPASNGLPRILRFSSFDPGFVVHGITTRSGRLPLNGNMSYMVGDDVDLVRRNRQTWARAIGFDWSRLVLGWQVHETTVAVVSETDAGSGARGVETALQRVDGLITKAPGLPIGVMAADCVPILLYDPDRSAVAAIHAGWRGTVDGIAAESVRAMKAHFGSAPEKLRACLGPSICQTCYEVGSEVVERWASTTSAEGCSAMRESADGYYFDLRQANHYLLVTTGVAPDAIEVSDICTRCSNGTMFSRRGLGPRTGLFTSVIMLASARS